MSDQPENVEPSQNLTDNSENTVISNTVQAEVVSDKKSHSHAHNTIKPKISEFVVKFCHELDQHLTPLQLKKQLRRLSSGIFIDEVLLPDLLKAFALWQARLNNSSATVDDKTVEKFLGDKFPQTYYLIEGKLCVVGYLLPVQSPDNLKNLIPEFKGSLTSTLDLLHPRDPQIFNIKNIEVQLDRTGFGVKIRTKNRSVFVTTAGLKSFQNALARSPRLRRRYPSALLGLRGAIVPLEKLLHSARPVRHKQTILIPSELRLQKDLEYLRVGGFFLVLSNTNNQLITAYELRGRNFRSFIFSELDLLRQSRSRNIGIMEVYRKRGAIVGALRTEDGEFNLLHIDALFKGIEMVLRRRSLRRKLPVKITLYDCIKLISKLFSESIRIEAREVPYQIIRHYCTMLAESKTLESSHKPRRFRRPKSNKNSPERNIADSLRYRSGAGWIFFIHDRKIVKSLYEKPQQQKPATVVLKTGTPNSFG